MTLSAKVQPVLWVAAGFCVSVGLIWGFFGTPDDFRQGSTVKIIYLHVPAALMAINAWFMMFVASLIWLIRRHHVSALAAKAADFGYDGLELACWGDHFEVDRALDDPNYVVEKRALLDRYNLECHAISNHLAGQAVCDRIDERHQSILPPRLWGDGDPAAVQSRAAEEMKNDEISERHWLLSWVM